MLPNRLRTITASLMAAGLLAACSDDPTDPEIPPTGVAAVATSATSVRVTFNAVAGADGYRVERATGATGGTFEAAGTTTTTTYDDTGLAPATAYRYRVAALKGGQPGPFSTEAAVSTQAPAAVTISEDITSNRTLHADTVYTLSGFIKVANGATLTIQPGTKIVGDYDVPGSSLFVLRGAKINAVGTAERPIVFTSERPEGQRQPGDWGGVIIVGNARINRASPVILEGTGTGAANPQVDYSGGTDDADDSGELRYVRIEFAGYATAPDAELNSLTLAAVGSGTRLSYIQTMAGLDDSFEWFGGTVDGKYLVSYESGDDHFDASEGFRGRNQFVIALQSTILQPRPAGGNVSNDPQGIENDGCAGSNCFDGQNSTPLTMPMFANFTLVGTGPGVVDATSGGIGMMLRRGTGGYYVNGVAARWPRAAISLRDAATKARIDAGELQVKNLLLADNGATFQPQVEGSSTLQYTLDLEANAIEVAPGTAASLFAGLPATPTTEGLDWTPAAGSPARTGGMSTFSGDIAAKAGSVVTATAYRGAADPAGAKWWAGWTSYARN